MGANRSNTMNSPVDSRIFGSVIARKRKSLLQINRNSFAFNGKKTPAKGVKTKPFSTEESVESVERADKAYFILKPKRNTLAEAAMENL